MSPLIHLVAGEESGDVLGAALMRALRAQRPDVRFGGLGGHAMAEQGIESPFDIHELSIIGFGSIPRALPRILRRIRQTADAVIAARPDALVIIDSPDFTHRVARRVRKAAPQIAILNYAPPSVWAWRSWRARAMREYVDEVLAILPFEPEAYLRLDGPPCTYVGHPLSERLSALRPDDCEEQRRLSNPPVVLVLPGSRGSEIRQLGAMFGEAIREAAAKAGPFDLVLPTLPRIAERVRAATADWPVKPRIVTGEGEKEAAFRVARAALAASGTVTLELALAQVPFVAGYRVPLWEGWLFQLMSPLDTANIVNIILNERVVLEHLQSDCRADNLAAGLVSLLSYTPERRRQMEAFARLDAVMQVREPPSRRAAEAVLAAIERPK